jgi:hypothetical protein
VNDGAPRTAPLVLFAYNRPRHLERVIEALRRDPLSERTRLVVFSDGPADGADEERVKAVRSVLDGIRGFASVEIVKRERNLGLARSVIGGVSEVIEVFGEVVVLEDDLLVSPLFLDSLNRLLHAYEGNERVFSVTGYSYPARLVRIPRDYPYTVYFSYRASSWGWATWKDRWSRVDWEVGDYDRFVVDAAARRRFDMGGADLTEMLEAQMNGRLDSWAIRWCYSSFRLDMVNVYPVRTLVRNIGLDGSGVHCDTDERLEDEIDTSFPSELVLPSSLAMDRRIVEEVRRIYAADFLSRVRRKLRETIDRVSTIGRS